MKRIVFAFAAFVFVVGLATESFAQQVPGSYRQTCRNVRFDGAELSAVCLDRFGRPNPTSIFVDSCRGDIANRDGQLSCPSGRGGGPRGFDDGYRGPPPRRDYGGDGFRGGWQGLPGGSWRRSCTDASMQGPILVAACATARGNYRQTSADARSCRAFGNANGNLVCE